MSSEKSVIMVTGGSGLVGKAIQWVIDNVQDPRYGKREGEEWVFLTSKDGNLMYVTHQDRLRCSCIPKRLALLAPKGWNFGSPYILHPVCSSQGSRCRKGHL